MQALENTAPDLAPLLGQHAPVGRDHEYVRHSRLSLLAGNDLWNGEVLGFMRDRHRSAEFVEFARLVDARYPPTIRLTAKDQKREHSVSPTILMKAKSCESESHDLTENTDG